jgi:hypothetical protein
MDLWIFVWPVWNAIPVVLQAGWWLIVLVIVAKVAQSFFGRLSKR